MVKLRQSPNHATGTIGARVRRTTLRIPTPLPGDCLGTADDKLCRMPCVKKRRGVHHATLTQAAEDPKRRARFFDKDLIPDDLVEKA